MRSLTLHVLTACFTILVGAASLRAEANLDRLVAEAAKYESGQSAEPIQKIEQLLRDSATRPALRADLEAAMVKLLAPSATFEARRFACQILGAIGTDASLPAVARLLADEETVGIGCLALSSQRSPKAGEILRGALASARGLARLQIIGALGNHDDVQSVGALTSLAHDADAAVADAAILALGKIGSKAARQAVATLDKQAKPGQTLIVTDATLRVARQLALAGDRSAAAAIYTRMLRPECPANVRRGALAALLNLDADGGQQRILDTLRGADAALVPVAIARVGVLKAVDASKTFGAALPTLPHAAQVWMIEALASRGDAAAREALRSQVAASDPAVRRAAVSAVGRLDDASAAGLLVAVLNNAKTPEELLCVELALGNLRGGSATDDALVAQLKQASGPAKVCLFSVLTRRGAHAAVPVLLAEVGGSDAEMVQAAFRSLGRLAAAADVPAVLDKLACLKAADARAEAQIAAARAMAKIADAGQRSATVCAAIANTSDVDARCSLLRLLPGAADAAALAALKTAGGDKDPRVRDAAVRALAAWPGADAWDALLAVFVRPENTTHRALALRALVRLTGDLNAKPDAALIERYRRLLAGTQSDDDRKLILGSLSGAAHPDALELALSMRASAAVRAEAELAVKKIAAAVAAQHPQAARDALQRLKRPAK